MVAAGMMKMAIGDDFPLLRSAGTGSRLVFRGYRGLRHGTSDLGLPSGFLEYLTIYRAKRGCRTPSRWAQPTWACLGPMRALVGCAPSGHPQVQPGPIAFLLAHKKSSWSFVTFGLCLILISCDVKNMEKIATGTWHYVNRLVPKNDIK